MLPATSAGKPAAMPVLETLQVLRFLAAFLVLCHHASAQYVAMGGASGLFVFVGEWGFVGVEVFFVLSGFVMAHTTRARGTGPSEAIEFLRRRLLRVYLGYWPFLLLALAAAAWIIHSTSPDLDLWGSISLTQTDMRRLALPVSWSLSFEVYFYVAFAGFLLLPKRAFPWAVGAAFAGIAFVQLVVHPTGTIDFVLSGYTLEFLAGIGLRLLMDRVRTPWLVPVWLALAVGGLWLGIHHEVRTGFQRIETYGVFAVGTVALCLTLERVPGVRMPRWAVALGDASYTLYLFHSIAFSCLYYVGLRTWLGAQAPVLRELGFVAYVLAVLGFSVAFYRWVEAPLYKWAVARTRRPSPTAALQPSRG